MATRKKKAAPAINPAALAALERGKEYCYYQDDHENAVKEYTKAIELDPKFADAWICRGDTYRLEGYYDEAIKDYTEALRLDPNDVCARYFRGKAYDDNSDGDKAIQDFTKVIELNPNDGHAHFFRAWRYYYKKDFDNAIKGHTATIKLAPTDGGAYTGRGYAYQRIGRYDEAIKDFAEAVRLEFEAESDPEFFWYTHGAMWRTYKEKRDHDGAARYFTKAIKLYPNDLSAHFFRAEIYLEWEKDYRNAIKGYTELIRLKKDCRNTIREYLSLEPDCGTYNLRRADAYLAIKDYDSAIMDYTEAIRLNPGHYRSYCCRAEAYLAKKDYDNAIISYTEAIERDIDFYCDRGDAYLAKKDYDNAFKDYDAAIKSNNTWCWNYYRRAKAYRTVKRYNDAINDCVKAISLYPEFKEAKALLKKLKQFIAGGSK